MKKRWIPFHWLPASWGLTGTIREEAEAGYYYEGEELDRKLAEIRHRGDPDGLVRMNLLLDLQWGKITERAYEEALAALDYKDLELEIRMIEIACEFNDITENEMEKKIADLREEPWVGVIEDSFDANEGIDGFSMTLDWNDYFIDFLRINGYGGNSQEEIVERWFADVNRDVAEREIDGFDIAAANPRRMTTRIDRGDGKADYS